MNFGNIVTILFSVDMNKGMQPLVIPAAGSRIGESVIITYFYSTGREFNFHGTPSSELYYRIVF